MNSPEARISSPVGLACLTILAVMGSLQNLAGVHLSRDMSDPVSLGERRFDALRRSLPAHGRIGYIGDLDPASESGNRARLLAQYSLVPLIIVPPLPFPRNLLDPALQREPRDSNPAPDRTPDPALSPEWFAGDFRDAATATFIARREGLVIVRDFGAGVMLLHKPK